MSLRIRTWITSVLTIVVSLFSFFSLQAHAQPEGRGNYGSDPVMILDKVVKTANEDYKIQESQLDKVSEKQGSFPTQYKIANTLDSVRQRIPLYLQWAVFVGLTVAVIVLIINGLMMVAGQKTVEQFKDSAISVVYWILILTGFYVIIRLGVALLTTIFGDGTGTTGF